MREVPTRLDKDKMKEFAQLDDRYAVSLVIAKIRAVGGCGL